MIRLTYAMVIILERVSAEITLAMQYKGDQRVLLPTPGSSCGTDLYKVDQRVLLPTPGLPQGQTYTRGNERVLLHTPGLQCSTDLCKR